MTERAEVLRTRELIGWSVTDPDGAAVGTVTELLLGRDGRVRFVAVRRGVLAGSVLLPADELTWSDDALRLARWSAEEARRLPGWDGDAPVTAAVLEEMARAHPRHYGTPPRWDAPRANPEAGVLPLREAKGFRLPKDAPDPKGWEVFGSDNERVGTVEGLLVDPGALKVRYLDVDLADDLYRLREDRHVVIPMEAVELRERGRDVWIRGLPARAIAALPAYVGGPLDPLLEEAAREAFSGVADAPADPQLLADEEPAAAPEPLADGDAAPATDAGPTEREPG